MDVDDGTFVCTTQQTLAQARVVSVKETNLRLLADKAPLVASGTFTAALLVVEADLAAVVTVGVAVVERGGRDYGGGALDAGDGCSSGDSEEDRKADYGEELHCVDGVCCDVEWM